MKNNFTEEKTFNQRIKDAHEKILGEYGLPEWIKIPCPYCKKTLKVSDVRKIAFCFNARNAGDLALEFACSECGYGDTVYWRKNFGHILDMASFLTGETPKGEPVLEELMYKASYNNIVEEMVKREKNKKEIV